MACISESWQFTGCKELKADIPQTWHGRWKNHVTMESDWMGLWTNEKNTRTCTILHIQTQLNDFGWFEAVMKKTVSSRWTLTPSERIDSPRFTFFVSSNKRVILLWVTWSWNADLLITNSSCKFFPGTLFFSVSLSHIDNYSDQLKNSCNQMSAIYCKESERSVSHGS